MQRRRAGQIDVDDLTLAGRSANDRDLSRLEAEGGRDGVLDGSVGLAFDGPRANPHLERLAVKPSQVKRLEDEIDTLNAELAPLRTFVLAGGTAAAAYLHLARTICRRAERIMVELRDQPGETVTDASLKYVNRLSDFLFVAGRYANDKGARDVLWAPGQNR